MFQSLGHGLEQKQHNCYFIDSGEQRHKSLFFVFLKMFFRDTADHWRIPRGQAAALDLFEMCCSRAPLQASTRCQRDWWVLWLLKSSSHDDVPEGNRYRANPFYKRTASPLGSAVSRKEATNFNYDPHLWLKFFPFYRLSPVLKPDEVAVFQTQDEKHKLNNFMM